MGAFCCSCLTTVVENLLLHIISNGHYLPLFLTCSGPVTHSGEILTTGKSHGKNPDRLGVYAQTEGRDELNEEFYKTLQKLIPLVRVIVNSSGNSSTSRSTNNTRVVVVEIEVVVVKR